MVTEVGPDTAYNLAQTALARGIWTDDELHDIGFRAVMTDIKDIVNRVGISGLPLGAFVTRQGEQKSVVWNQLTLPDFHEFLPRRIKSMCADYEVIQVQLEYCFDKFGETPTCPRLVNHG